MRQLLLTILAALTLAACSSTDSTGIAQLDDAVAHFDAGSYDEASSQLDHIVADSAAFQALGVAPLCRMAQLSMQLDSALNTESGNVVAARCLGRARQLNADSVDAYIESLPMEQATQMRLINSVSSYLTMPRDSLVTDSDTIQ